MLLTIKSEITELSDFVLFEANTVQLREDYKTRIREYFVTKSEVKEYSVKCDEINNPASVVNNRQFFAEISFKLISEEGLKVIEIRRDTTSVAA